MSRVRSLALGFGLFLLLGAAVAQADFRMERELDLDPGGELVLDTPSGRITVRGTNREGARVLITSTRDDIESRFRFDFSGDADRATIKVEKRGSFTRRWFDWGSSLHFEIEVPQRVSLLLDTSGGAIEVSDIEGAVDADTSGGAIEARRITGPVRLDTSGGSIRAERIDGNLVADTSGGSITVEGVSGDVEADTSGGSVTVRDAGGRVMASSSGGPVTAYFSPGNSAGGSLSTSGGRAVAYVDPGANLDIDIATSGGRASVDLPLTVRGSVSKSSLRGQVNGGGATLRLRSSGGSVSVRSL